MPNQIDLATGKANRVRKYHIGPEEAEPVEVFDLAEPSRRQVTVQSYAFFTSKARNAHQQIVCEVPLLAPPRPRLNTAVSRAVPTLDHADGSGKILFRAGNERIGSLPVWLRQFHAGTSEHRAQTRLLDDFSHRVHVKRIGASFDK